METRETHPRAEVMSAIRQDNIGWAFTLAQWYEDDLSEGAKIAICKSLNWYEGAGYHDMWYGNRLALKWGVFRKVHAR